MSSRLPRRAATLPAVRLVSPSSAPSLMLRHYPALRDDRPPPRCRRAADGGEVLPRASFSPQRPLHALIAERPIGEHANDRKEYDVRHQATAEVVSFLIARIESSVKPTIMKFSSVSQAATSCQPAANIGVAFN